MSDNENLEYNLPQNAYVNFDAVSLKDFMINRLNETSTFTDQTYEGSNLSSLIEILAYYTHVLLFYTNQSSTESLFSQASIYENMNRIVKLIQYKPTGKQTSLVPANCVASDSLAVGSYLLRKYSYFLIDNIQYSIINDLAFEKTVAGTETIDSINENLILYQGTIGEYPIYTADGIDFETFPVVVDNLTDSTDTRFISHGTISVFVKEVDTDVWYEYDEIDNLYLSSPHTRVYDLRLNENGHYEVKFGNNSFGRKLKTGDQVAVYYILSNGDRGIIGKNVINGNKLFNFASVRFDEIYNDITGDTVSQIIDTASSAFLTFTNPVNSSTISEAETVEQIRNNAPALITSQFRLVTENDYDIFLKKSIPSILNSVRTVSNDSFLNTYIDYFYKICIDPNKTNRVILNQVNFSDSCDFNNINIFCVPSFSITNDGDYPPFMSDSFKTLILDLTKNKKMINYEIVPRDPVYIAFDLGFSNLDPTKDVYNDTQLVIVRETTNKINKETLKRSVKNIILDFFDASNNVLGGTIDMSSLNSSILSLEGIKGIRTENAAENILFNGVSFITWNPMFPDVDQEFVNQTTTLPFFKFPYFYRPNNLINKIQIVDE